MKKLLLIAFLTISICGYTQEIKYTDLATSSRGEFTSYVSKDGSVYKIGDRIKIGKPSANATFAYITQGDGVLIGITQLPANSSGQETEIKKIFVVGNKRVGYSVSFRTKGVSGLLNYSIAVENAIDTNEIKSFGMSSDDALTELKKSKDKLDLGLISQADYDLKKADLVKYIK
ncbi:hypothetical protein [Flavobacterium sp. ZB4P13]|uniref:hypothetical protein n=1 Tax=Flavobacterium sp. ZB4P13 TaxID=3401728 RepID=UPI003AB06513